MDNGTTESAWVHAIRAELRARRETEIAAAGRRMPRKDGSGAVTINVEDAIFTRLVEAEELLAVAVGLFTELAEDRENWLFRCADEIAGARWALRNLIDDRKFA